MQTYALTTTKIKRDKLVSIKGSTGKRRRRTEDAEDWSRSRKQEWVSGVSFESLFSLGSFRPG